MKIAITGDTHLGYARWPDDAYAQAKQTLLKAAEVSDVILLAGDIFDKENPSITVMSQMLNILLELEERGWGKDVKIYDDNNNIVKSRLPVAVIRGTHERVEKNTADPIKLIGLTKYWVDVDDCACIFEKNNEKTRVFGMGGVPEDLAKEIMKTMAPLPKPDMFNIFMLHQTFEEFIPIKKPEFLCLNDLPEGFDLYVNGHIHKHHVELDGKFIIPGSTVITQLKNEEQGNKGFVVYDTMTKNFEFMKINSRPFVLEKINMEDATQQYALETVNKKINEIVERYNKPIIKLVLQGTLAKGLRPCDIMVHISNNKAFKIYIDNDFEDYTIESTISKVKQIKKGSSDPKEMGNTILMKKLKEIEFAFPDHKKLFDALADSADSAIQYIENTNLLVKQTKETSAQHNSGSPGHNNDNVNS